MISRKIVDEYEHNSAKMYNRIFDLISALQRQIEYTLKYEEENELLKENLDKLNNLKNILKKYIDSNSSCCIGNLTSGLIKYMAKKHPDGSFPKEDIIEFYTQSNIYNEYKKYINLVLKIEEEIHEKVTLRLWKEYCTPINKEFKQGDVFRYIVHSGYNIIKLPGLPGYEKNRHIDGDFVSASLITNEQMHLYNGNVGLILEPNESIMASAFSDAGTKIEDNQGLNSIIDFGNGTFANTRFDHIDEIPTKIQSPKSLHNEFMNELNRRNIKGLDEGWPVTEVILDDRKIKVIGVFFKTNGIEINLDDYVRARNMKRMYNVPLRTINIVKYKEKNYIDKYSEKDIIKFHKQLEDDISNNNDELIGYYNDIVCGADFECKIKELIRLKFKKTMQYNKFKEDTISRDD